jgi:aspartyl-tRNA(Asn)/glutamyl-tRNA(Gln) amidotransferase subunit B
MPDLDSSTEAYAYLTKLRQIVLYLGINDGNMEEGSLRCDCNVSIRPKGSKELGTRSELKNMNSFRNVERAIEFEIKRQEGILRSGGRVIQETFLWDADRNEARAMRSKEEAHDYRYFPEPDLVPLLVKEEWVEEIRRSLPELPTEKARRFTEQYNLPKYDSYILTLDKTVAEYYEETVKICDDPKLVSHWVMGEVLRILKEANVTIGNFKISSNRLGEMLNLVLNGTINQKIAKTVFEEMMTSLDSPKEIIEKKGLVQVTDITLIEKTVDEVISGNPDQFSAYKSGKDKLIGFFVGEVMKRTQGKANPKIVNEILRKKLGG